MNIEIVKREVIYQLEMTAEEMRQLWRLLKVECEGHELVESTASEMYEKLKSMNPQGYYR